MARRSLNQTLADNLRRLMTAQGLSEAELGRKAGVAANTVGNYLDGQQFTPGGKERSAKLAEVERIAHALGVDALDLLSASPATPSAPPLPPQDRQVIDDLNDLSTLDPERRDRIVSDLHNAADHARAIARRARGEVTTTAAPKPAPAKAAAASRGSKSRLELRLGDGNPDQAALPLTTVDDPFSAPPSDREKSWYDRLPTAKGVTPRR